MASSPDAARHGVRQSSAAISRGNGLPKMKDDIRKLERGGFDHIPRQVTFTPKAAEGRRTP